MSVSQANTWIHSEIQLSVEILKKRIYPFLRKWNYSCNLGGLTKVVIWQFWFQHTRAPPSNFHKTKTDVKNHHTHGHFSLVRTYTVTMWRTPSQEAKSHTGEQAPSFPSLGLNYGLNAHLTGNSLLNTWTFLKDKQKNILENEFHRVNSEWTLDCKG